jgi:hypothetical protein
MAKALGYLRDFHAPSACPAGGGWFLRKVRNPLRPILKNEHVRRDTWGGHLSSPESQARASIPNQKTC